MPSVELAALAAGSLLGLAPMAVAAGGWRQASGFIYGASGALCVVVMLTGLLALIGNGPAYGADACPSACPGSEFISALTRCPPSSWWCSASAAA